MLDTAQSSTSHQLMDKSSLINLLEVFMDYFIGMTNNISQDHLRHFFLEILIGIHSVFPPPEVSVHQVQDPMSEKNMYQGEVTWETAKDTLVWLVYGAKFTL